MKRREINFVAGWLQLAPDRIETAPMPVNRRPGLQGAAQQSEPTRRDLPLAASAENFADGVARNLSQGVRKNASSSTAA